RQVTLNAALAVAPGPVAPTVPFPSAAPAGMVIAFEKAPDASARTLPVAVECPALSTNVNFTALFAANPDPVTVTVLPVCPRFGASAIVAGGVTLPPYGLKEGSAAPGISRLCVMLAQLERFDTFATWIPSFSPQASCVPSGENVGLA